ncbi:MAG TPA: glutathione S-transferase family protein [Croceibacterium sp.]|nr:glutathione S-transferase family protein [Croceibacterium sp.]
MKIYGFPLSPFVRKVLVTVKEKGLDAEVVPSNPSHPDPEFAAASPFHKIPAFRDGDFTMADSTAIVTYLEAKYPQPALLPTAPEPRARAIWFEEVADTICVPTGAPIVLNRFLRPNIFGVDGDEAAAVAAEQALKRPLDYLEQVVSDGWLDEDFTIGDIAVACAVRSLGYGGWNLDPQTHPRLTAWYGRVQQREGWQAAAEIEKATLAAAMGG